MASPECEEIQLYKCTELNRFHKACLTWDIKDFEKQVELSKKAGRGEIVSPTFTVTRPAERPAEFRLFVGFSSVDSAIGVFLRLVSDSPTTVRFSMRTNKGFKSDTVTKELKVGESSRLQCLFSGQTYYQR